MRMRMRMRMVLRGRQFDLTQKQQKQSLLQQPDRFGRLIRKARSCGGA
jgi:hypothetical protein